VLLFLRKCYLNFIYYFFFTIIFLFLNLNSELSYCYLLLLMLLLLILLLLLSLLQLVLLYNNNMLVLWLDLVIFRKSFLRVRFFLTDFCFPFFKLLNSSIYVFYSPYNSDTMVCTSSSLLLFDLLVLKLLSFPYSRSTTTFQICNYNDTYFLFSLWKKRNILGNSLLHHLQLLLGCF
jgi:hypothetical protein